MNEPSAASAVKTRGYTRWLRIAVTVGAFAYLFSKVNLHEVFASLNKIPVSAWIPAGVLMCVSLLLGVLRWRYMLIAYGAFKIPNARELVRLYWIGFFYNTYVPGGVGGDLVRGVATSHAFEGSKAQSMTGSITVAFVERVSGVIGMLAVSAGAFLLWPITSLEHLEGLALVVLLVACLTPFSIALARRLGPQIRGVIGQWLSHLPPIESKTAFSVTLLLSIVIQAAGALAGHVLISALAPELPLSSSLVLIPLISATAFLPITVGGAGVREGAFAFLYGQIGVPAALSIAASLAFWMVQLVLGALGGILSFLENSPNGNAKSSPNAD